jgi:hypothetical protein
MVSDCVDIHMKSGLHSPSLTGETISTHARSNHDSCESENSTCLHFFFFARECVLRYHSHVASMIFCCLRCVLDPEKYWTMWIDFFVLYRLVTATAACVGR